MLLNSIEYTQTAEKVIDNLSISPLEGYCAPQNQLVKILHIVDGNIQCQKLFS